MRYLLITAILIGSTFLTGCIGGSVPRSVGLGKRPWLMPVPQFDEAEKAQLGALKNVLWTDKAEGPGKKPDGKVQPEELSVAKNPTLEKLQKNYLAYKAQFTVYMKEAWKINLNQLTAMDWKKEDAVWALTNELIKIGYSEEEIDEFSR